MDLTISPPHVLVLSPQLLDHVGRALRYPHIQKRYPFPESKIDDCPDYLRDVSDVVLGPTIMPVVLADPDDDEVIATAVDGRAEVIGTRDHHFADPAVLSYCAAHGIRILSDVSLVQELRAGAP